MCINFDIKLGQSSEFPLLISFQRFHSFNLFHSHNEIRIQPRKNVLTRPNFNYNSLYFPRRKNETKIVERRMSKIGTKENSKGEKNCRTNHSNFYFSFHRKRTFLSSWREKKRKERCSSSLERKAFFLKEGGARWLAIKQRRKLSAIVPTLPSTPSRTNEGEIRAKLSRKIVSRPPFTNSLTAGDPPEGGREGNNASPNRNQIASPFITNRLPFVLPPPPPPPPPPSSWTSFAPLFFAHHGIIEQDWWEPRDWRLGEREETLHPLHPSPPPDISRFVEWFVIHTRTNMCIIYLEYMFHTIFPSSEVSIRFRTRRYRSTLDGLAWKHTFRGTYIYIFSLLRRIQESRMREIERAHFWWEGVRLWITIIY